MREDHPSAASCTPPTGDIPATKLHALDQNRTQDPSVRRPTLYPLRQISSSERACCSPLVFPDPGDICVATATAEAPLQQERREEGMSLLRTQGRNERAFQRRAGGPHGEWGQGKAAAAPWGALQLDTLGIRAGNWGI